MGFKREAGVGVDIAMDIELARKGSEAPFLLLHEEVDRGGCSRPRVDEDGDGSSSREGGVIPSSAYNQSICTKCAES